MQTPCPYVHEAVMVHMMSEALLPLNVVFSTAVPLDRYIPGAQALFDIFRLITNCPPKLQVIHESCLIGLCAGAVGSRGLSAAKALALCTGNVA